MYLEVQSFTLSIASGGAYRLPIAGNYTARLGVSDESRFSLGIKQLLGFSSAIIKKLEVRLNVD